MTKEETQQIIIWLNSQIEYMKIDEEFIEEEYPGLLNGINKLILLLEETGK